MKGIYKITNKKNNKVYIGQASNLDVRISEHKQARYIPIDMWINMLGVENFEFEILEAKDNYTPEELDAQEQNYIKMYDSRNPDKGYNKQLGGFNNSRGEGNGRAKLTEDDVRYIRNAYANKESCKDCYELFKEKISFSAFQGVWQGRSWAWVMPEVFTEENKKWYTSTQNKVKASLTKEEVLSYRKYYVDHTREEVYTKMEKEKGQDFLKRHSFFKILTGDVRPESIYNEIPVYKKTLKSWIIEGKPVSTIPETRE